MQYIRVASIRSRKKEIMVTRAFPFPEAMSFDVGEEFHPALLELSCGSPCATLYLSACGSLSSW